MSAFLCIVFCVVNPNLTFGIRLNTTPMFYVEMDETLEVFE